MNKGLKISAYSTALLVFIIGCVMLYQKDLYGIAAIVIAALFSFAIYKQ